MPDLFQRIVSAFKASQPAGTKTDLTVQAANPAAAVSGTVFGPGQSLNPFAVNLPDVSGRIPARTWDYPPAYNIVLRPDFDRQATYQVLRWFSNSHLVTRAAINVRKKEIVGLDWDIVPIDKKIKIGEEAKNRVKEFFKKPDGVNPFSQWLNMLLEDLFVLDAPCMEKRRNRSGELIGLDIIDGATIKILIDSTGRLPLPPEPAYQQILKGFPRSQFTLDEMIYDPYNNPSNSPYGKSFLESALIEVNMTIRAMTLMLNYFTDGNIPPGFINAPEAASTPTAIGELQVMLNALLAGNDAKRQQLLVLPFGSDYKPAKDYDFSKYTELDKELTRKILMAFEVQPQEVGITFQVNKSSGEIQENITFRRSIKPLTSFLEDLFGEVIANDLGEPGLRLRFDDFQVDDALTVAQINQIYSGNRAVKTINEIRSELGYDPIPGGDELAAAQTASAAPAQFAYDWAEVEKELDRYERKAIGDLQNGRKRRSFLSDILPSNLLGDIEAALPTADSAEMVKAVFADIKKKYQPAGFGKAQSPSSKRMFPPLKSCSRVSTGAGGKASLNYLKPPNPY